MAEVLVPVDLFNPGQVFASIGLLEAAETLLGHAQAAFDWRDKSNTCFRLRAAGDQDPVATVISFLGQAEVKSLAPSNSELRTERWSVPTHHLTADEPFPFPMPASPATLPALLECPSGSQLESTRLMITYWGDDRWSTGRDNAKFWAGAGGYPGAALARDALRLVRSRVSKSCADPFNLSAEESSSFRFDWRRDYVPIDTGFSLNSHAKGEFSMVGFPLVEILAAIGLTNARPERIDTLEYRYGVLGVLDDLFDPPLIRASLGGPRLPFPQRTFRMRLGWPGKENQARCITTVTEEIIDDRDHR